jgi:hypothetical protein
MVCNLNCNRCAGVATSSIGTPPQSGPAPARDRLLLCGQPPRSRSSVHHGALSSPRPSLSFSAPATRRQCSRRWSLCMHCASTVSRLRSSLPPATEDSSRDRPIPSALPVCLDMLDWRFSPAGAWDQKSLLSWAIGGSWDGTRVVGKGIRRCAGREMKGRRDFLSSPASDGGRSERPS